MTVSQTPLSVTRTLASGQRDPRGGVRQVVKRPVDHLTRVGKILLVYNGQTTGAGGFAKNSYSSGQMLIDPANPKVALARLERPFIAPSTGDEQNGQVNNVVFSEGLVEFRDTYFLYFGMADSVLGVATWKP